MTLRTLADQIQEANATFLGQLADLESMADAMTAVPAGEVGRRLRLLRGIADEHFQLEERNGYLSPLMTCDPDSELKRRALLNDHRELLRTLKDLIRDADAGEGLTADLRDRLKHWIRDARQHEERENEFLSWAADEVPC
jgi:hypothetical protein